MLDRLREQTFPQVMFCVIGSEIELLMSGAQNDNKAPPFYVVSFFLPVCCCHHHGRGGHFQNVHCLGARATRFQHPFALPEAGLEAAVGSGSSARRA